MKPTCSVLSKAEWDTHRFAFPVARIADEHALAATVSAALAEARARGFRLVYWSSSPSTALPDEVLADFHGLLADRKATFVRELTAADAAVSDSLPVGWAARKLPRGPAPPALVRLAVAAGQHSRFRVD